MQTTEIYYEKVFPIAPYVNEKIGIKITIDPNDDVEEAFAMAKDTVNMWGHKLVDERPQGTPEFNYYGAPSIPEEKPEPPKKIVSKIIPDKAIRQKYAKAIVEGDKKTVELMENMYQFDATQE